MFFSKKEKEKEKLIDRICQFLSTGEYFAINDGLRLNLIKEAKDILESAALDSNLSVENILVSYFQSDRRRLEITNIATKKSINIYLRSDCFYENILQLRDEKHYIHDMIKSDILSKDNETLFVLRNKAIKEGCPLNEEGKCTFGDKFSGYEP